MKIAHVLVSQNFSLGFEGVDASGLDFAQVFSVWVTQAVAPANASDEKSSPGETEFFISRVLGHGFSP